MDQDLLKASLSKRELVYGGVLLIIQIYCLIYGAFVGVMRVGKDGIVMLIVLFIKIWNKTGILSLWCFLDVYANVLLCGVGLASLAWRHGCGWWPITGLLCIVLALFWYGTMDAFGSLVKIYLGIMVHIRLRSRRWDMRGILGNNEDVFEFLSFGVTCRSSQQLKGFI